MQFKNFYLLSIFFFLIPFSISAQHKPAKKPSKIWFKPVKLETDEVKLEGKNAVSEKEITKFKWIITNYTKDFLIIQPQECNFKTASAEILPNDKKKIVIHPLETESKVIDGTNTKNNSVHELNFSFYASGIYKSEDAVAEAMPDFKIPPSNNTLDKGDFRIELVSYNAQSNNQLKIKLKVTYSGKGVGIIEPAKISAKVAGDVTIPNSISDKMFVLQRGESGTFTTFFNNFQQVNMIWNDTFKSASLKKLDNVEMKFEYDPEQGK